MPILILIEIAQEYLFNNQSLPPQQPGPPALLQAMARSEQAATEPGNKPEREVLVEGLNLKQGEGAFDGKMIEMMILAALAMQRMNISLRGE